MIVVLCPGYEAAEWAYYEFLSFAKCSYYSADVIAHHDAGLCVTLDDDLTYIFIDEHWQRIVEQDLPETVDWDYMDSFIEDLYNDDPLPWYP